MSTTEPSSPDQDRKRQSRLRWLLISQVALLLAAAIAFAYIGWHVKPLLERLEGLKQQIAQKEEVLRELNAAIKRTNNEALVSEAGQIELVPLRGYRVGIYYLEGNKGAEARANNLMSALQGAHSPAVIALYAKPASFFDYYGYSRPAQDQLRYEPDYETAQAQALATLLRNVDPSHTYALTPVQNRTPNFVSVFLRDGL
jgi:hypothetical protein